MLFLWICIHNLLRWIRRDIFVGVNSFTENAKKTSIMQVSWHLSWMNLHQRKCHVWSTVKGCVYKFTERSFEKSIKQTHIIFNKTIYCEALFILFFSNVIRNSESNVLVKPHPLMHSYKALTNFPVNQTSWQCEHSLNKYKKYTQ